MRVTDRKRLQVLRRVRDFLKPMAEEPTLSTVLAELDALIARMTVESNLQDSHDRQAKIGADQVSALARTLRIDLLRPVLHLVRSVAPDAFNSGLPGVSSLTLPKSEDRQGLITAANGVYDVAKPYEVRLTAAGLPKDHLARLQAGSDALRDAIDARAQSVLRRGAAGTSTIAASRRSGQLIRLIESLVAPLLRGDAGKLRAWSAAKRLGYRVVSSADVAVEGGSGASSGSGAATGADAATGSGALTPAVGALSEGQTGVGRAAADGAAGEVSKAA